MQEGRGISNPRKPGTELTREEESTDTAGYRATNLDPAQSLSVGGELAEGNLVTPPKNGPFFRARPLAVGCACRVSFSIT